MSHRYKSHSSHWGPYMVADTGNGDVDVNGSATDPRPSRLLRNIPGTVRHKTRVARPAVRRSWLESGPGPGPRSSEFVEVNWEVALDLVSREVERVAEMHGNGAIFGGSYGWSSAGRFHHAQSQVHRFLNSVGGYVGSVNTYSAGAAEVILPHILAPYSEVSRNWVTWDDVAANTELIIAFGGMAEKNFQVSGGGVAKHTLYQSLSRAGARGCEIVSLSPLADDFPVALQARRLGIRPYGDVPIMLALAYQLVAERLYDREFVNKSTVGFERFLRYLDGGVDGVKKTPSWASALSGLDESTIRELARKMATRRSLINVSHSLQRAEHGEQPVWLGVVLAAMIGQIGLPGCGFSYALGSMANAGKPSAIVSLPKLPQGVNPIKTSVPVARIADMLHFPGERYDYNGTVSTYPEIRMVYWAGGNPFHHHQDLFRLRSAFERVDTLIVHEQYWTATARLADIVLPATLSLERNDIGAGPGDSQLFAMPKILDPYCSAADDYWIFSQLAKRLNAEMAFTEARSSDEWIKLLYDGFRARLMEAGREVETFEEFWKAGVLDLPVGSAIPLSRFRESPERFPLKTPSGKIEIYSSRIAGFSYPDCPGHPAWLFPSEWIDPAPESDELYLIANNPATRLHSQLDPGAESMDSKVAGREPVRMNPQDAAARGINDGEVVMLQNDRGACLAGVRLWAGVLAGTMQLSTGAWFEPQALGGVETCIHGNPNVLTKDVGTSPLAQGCSGQLTVMRVSRFPGPPPEVSVTRETPAFGTSLLGSGDLRLGSSHRPVDGASEEVR